MLDGDTLYWLESRPDQGGRVDLLRRTVDGTTEPVTSDPFNVRSRVHEYGGGAYAVRDGVVVFSDFSRQPSLPGAGRPDDTAHAGQ